MATLIATSRGVSSAGLKITTDTYLVLYGSGFLTPSDLTSHNTGDAFKKVAEARHKINKKNNPKSICELFFCPTDFDFFEYIKKSKSIKRLDVYCHGWLHGINLGGFTGKRKINGVDIDGDKFDWDDKNQDKGKDLRRVEIYESSYLASTEINELDKLDSSVFSTSVEVYFWGCNIGGQLDPKGKHVANNDPYIADPKESFAQKFYEAIGTGTTFALVGKGTAAGSMFKTDAKGKEYFDDGEMIPANISANNKNINTMRLNAMDYMKKFPI